MKRKPNRLRWSRLSVPSSLADLFYILAKQQGYSRDQAHLFLWETLKKAYPAETALLRRFVEVSTDELKSPDTKE